MIYPEKKEFRIADLVRKQFLVGELTTEENEFLEEWLSVQKNEQWYDAALGFEKLKAKDSFYKSIDVEAAFKKNEQKRNAYPSVMAPLFNYTRFMQYAAVFLIVLGIACFFVFNSIFETQKTIVVSTVLPKYNHPTLVLEDGTAIVLDSSKSTIVSKNKIISNKKGVLVYDTRFIKGAAINASGIHSLLVPVGGIYAVTLSDGTTVWLNSQSVLRYPIHFSQTNRTVSLEGEAYFEVTKNQHKPFIVHTKMGNVTVLGTHFNVNVHPNEGFATTLAEGSVRVSNFAGKQKQAVLLKPGQQAELEQQSGNMRVIAVDAARYMAWKEGKFYFENENLKSILTKVARWYNVKVNFSNPALQQIKFTGMVEKDRPLDYLLDIISKTSNTKYQITQTNQAYEVAIIK